MAVDPSITWLLVSTSPDEEMIIPVPSAVSFLYFSVETMSTRPGSTFFTTAAGTSGADEDPLPAALLCGAGTSLEEIPAAGAGPWLSTATGTPAPMPAPSAATPRETRKRPPRLPPPAGGSGGAQPPPGPPLPPPAWEPP